MIVNFALLLPTPGIGDACDSALVPQGRAEEYDHERLLMSAPITAFAPVDSETATEAGGDGLLLAVQNLAGAHDRHEAERSDITSSQNSAGDDGENRDLNLPRN